MSEDPIVTALLPIIRSELPKLRAPGAGDKVYNDECVYSFDSPFSETGLYVDLVTYQGVGLGSLPQHVAKTNSKLFLFAKWEQVRKEEEEIEGGWEKIDPEPTKLAIGVEGGFSPEDTPFEVKKDHFLVAIQPNGVPSSPIPLTHTALPEFVGVIAQGVIDHAGIRASVNEGDAWGGDDVKVVSKYAEDLVQLDNGKKISNDPSSWRCEMSGDTQNLWLNLSTGYIGGGRKNWDGSGGSGAALKHFEETGRQYPLCVKLGTITPAGGDVYSYAPDEDDLVLDPKLAEHLSHWGIDIMRLEKTDKSMSEMEVDLNLKYDWARIMEQGRDVVPLSGPGLIGLRNIGSSCYINSVMQVISSLPEVSARYFSGAAAILATAPRDAENDFPVQMSKLVSALLSDKYVMSAEVLEDSTLASMERYVVAPRMFKQLVARGNAEFTSGRQQDASEYFQHVLNYIIRAERNAIDRITSGQEGGTKRNTASIFEFYPESRYQDVNTGKVRYMGGKTSSNVQNVLELLIPVEQAVNKEEVEMAQASKKSRTEGGAPVTPAEEAEEVKLLVPFEACLDTYFGSKLGGGLVEMAGGVTASKTTKLLTFPRYLMVKLGRYTVDSSWRQVKIDARVPMPESLDLNHMRASGLQPGEEEMPEEGAAAGDSAAAGAGGVVPDEVLVSQLVSMGFSENACRRAAIAVNNVGPDEAMAWVFAHMEDPDFNDPPEAAASATQAAATGTGATADPEAIVMLTSMGFTDKQAAKALKNTDNNLERAADWLFNHPDDDGSEDPIASSSSPADVAMPDESASGRYELLAIISHIGRNTDCGHYVSHIKKNGKWVFFNDDKVAESTNPPLDCGFMYLYRRLDIDSPII